MESWMIGAGVAVISGVAIFAVIRANVQRLGRISERHTAEINSLEKQIAKFATMREVRQEFVSKEMFTQIQRHFDDEFKRLEQGLSKILDKMEKQK